MYITSYLIHTPPLAALLEYQQHVKNKGIDKTIIPAKSDGYPMERVQLDTTINALKMRHGDYFYACTPNDLGC